MISVIIPTLNEEDYIEYTLKSLKNQNFKQEYEIIVVDANSTDKTREIAEKYAKVVNAKKRGVSFQRNLGVKEASGDLLLFSDADIIAAPNLIEDFVETLKKEEIIGVSAPILILSSNLEHRAFYWTISQIKKSSIDFGRAICGGGILGIKREVFEKVGGFDEKLKIGEDADFTMKASKYGKFVFLKSTLALTWPRREEKWGTSKLTSKWLDGYLKYKVLGKEEDYEVIR